MKKERNSEGWIRVLLLILPYIFIVGMFQIIGGFLVGVNFDNDSTTLYQDVVISFFGLIGTLLLLLIFMKYVDKEDFITIGFQTKNRFNDFVFGNLLGFFIIGFGFLLLLFLDEINFNRFDYNRKDMLYSFILFVIVAVSEEVLFRGYILKNLLLSLNKYVAIIISSILFALAHGANPNLNLIGFIDLFLAGIVLAIPYVYTKNLWLIIAFHFSWNFFQTHFGFNVSGKDIYSFIETSFIEANWLNGGAFGFEGSILAVIGELLLILTLFLYYNKKIKPQTRVKS